MTFRERIIEELEKKPIENSLLLYDLNHEKRERIELHPIDSRNFLLMWKAFKIPDVSIRTDSREKAEKLLDMVKHLKCSFTVPQNVATLIDEKYKDMKKENWLLYTTNKKRFRRYSQHKVERLESKREYIEKIANDWNYSNDPDFVGEKMSKYPFFGIKKKDNLVSFAGTYASTKDVYFLGFAHTDEKFRRQGMMKSITSTFVDYSFIKNKVPAMYIVESNKPSRTSVEKVGFFPIATHVKFDPKLP